MIHLRSLTRPEHKKFPDEFPYSVPVIRDLSRLDFHADVTFFVGENGSGKSTLLETIGCAARLPTVGSEGTDSDPSLAAMRKLANMLKWEWTKRMTRGFFMRSEDFFGYAKRISKLRDELRDEMKSVSDSFSERGGKAQGLATMPYQRELAALQESYGEGLDAQSHGESYFKLFRARFVADGLYLLDEPEAPLSPTRQLAFLASMHEMVKKYRAQFIIATHSPILLAYPGAEILSFDDGAITPTKYNDLEHVIVTRTFLNNPAAYLSRLLDADDS